MLEICIVHCVSTQSRSVLLGYEFIIKCILKLLKKATYLLENPFKEVSHLKPVVQQQFSSPQSTVWPINMYHSTSVTMCVSVYFKIKNYFSSDLLFLHFVL